jgi:hypothetical protein
VDTLTELTDLLRFGAFMAGWMLCILTGLLLVKVAE